MAQVTTNPLPAGRYWIDLIGAERIARFGGGVEGLNEAHPGLIRIVSATRHLANEAKDYAESPDLTGDLVKLWESLAGSIEDTPERDWVLFEVIAPAIWDFDAMGVPTVAGPNIKSESDTGQRPAPEADITTQIQNAAKSAAGTVTTVVYILAAAAGLGLLISISKRGGVRLPK